MRVTIVRSRAIDPAANKLAKSLYKSGYDVRLLVWDRKGNLEGKDGEGYKICKFDLKAPYDKSTVLLYLPLWWLYEFFFLIKDNPDIIHACDLDTLIPAIFVKTIRKVNICYTIYDFYAEDISEQIPSIVKNCLVGLEKFLIRFTDVLFLVDKSRYEQVKGAKINTLAYIYNSPPDYFDVKQKSNEKRNITTLFYAGLIHKSRGLEYMIRAIEDLDNIKLIIAGEGPDESLIEDISIDTKKKIQYIGQISYKNVIKKTLSADILFAFYDPQIPNNKYASPNKLFESMMCGKPIIVSDGSSMANIVRRENCGIVVPYSDIESIKETIVKLKDDPKLRNELGENGRRAYEREYSWKIMENRLINAYNKIATKNNIEKNQ